MAVHLTDHFVFRSRRLKERTKYGVFATYVLLIVGTFWWFKGVAFGIEGPIAEHWGLRWRKVSSPTLMRNGYRITILQSWNMY